VSGPARSLLIGGVLLASSACAGAPVPSPVTSEASRDGLALDVALSAGPHSLIVESQLANEGAEPVHVVPTQCGRVMEALLARTTTSDPGRSFGGSVGALKELVLDRQVWDERPDRFEPRRPGDTSSATPECVSPDGPAELAPGALVAERWELPFGRADTLADVGSAASYVRVEAVVARSPEDVEFLDFAWEGMADDERAGRNVRVELPVEQVLQREPSAERERPLGLLFDRLMQDAQLRAWIAAQPEDGWRDASLAPAWPDVDDVRFTAQTTAFERPLEATADADGRVVSFVAPTEADRTRVFPRRPATLPPGVDVIQERDAWIPTEDLLPGDVRLPSGRIAVGEFLFEEEVLDIVVPAGRYPVHATLARPPDGDDERVALVTLVLSDAATTRWRFAYAFPVDGGTTNITSVEGATAERAAIERDDEAWMRRSEERFWSLSAHDHLATEVTIDGDLNLVLVGSGVGDGGYPVHIGLDEAGEPTRVVVDFLLVHLDWETAVRA
jgi:hypothetical protein